MSVHFNTTPPPAAATAQSAAPQSQTVSRPQAPAAPPPSAATTVQAVRQINEFLKSSAAAIEFTVDKQLGRVIVRIIDAQTKQVIRQLPTEEMIAISKSIERMTSLLIHHQA